MDSDEVEHLHVPEALEIYASSGIGNRAGYGERPALLVVDFQNGFTDPNCRVGGDLSNEVYATSHLLEKVRKADIPVAFTAVGFNPDQAATNAWLRKMPGLGILIEGGPLCEIDRRVGPRPGEPVWIKQASSAFFGTPLSAFLAGMGIDTLILVGCVTSGCIRATAVDAVSMGYRTIVPRECIGDRALGPHLWNMFDIDSKYADLEPLESVMKYVENFVPAVPGA